MENQQPPEEQKQLRIVRLPIGDEHMKLFEQTYMPIFPQLKVVATLFAPPEGQKVLQVYEKIGELNKRDLVINLGDTWGVVRVEDVMRVKFEFWLLQKGYITDPKEIIYNEPGTGADYCDPRLETLWCVWKDAVSSTVSGC